MIHTVPVRGTAEIVTNSFRSSFYLDTDTKIASVRAGNVIGGGDWAKDRLIPDVIESIKNGKKIILRNPSLLAMAIRLRSFIRLYVVGGENDFF